LNKDIDEQWTVFVSKLNDAIDKCVPKVKINSNTDIKSDKNISGLMSNSGISRSSSSVNTELKKSARKFAFSLSELVNVFLSLSMYKSGIEVQVLVFE
jgi:hypothetical protein